MARRLYFIIFIFAFCLIKLSSGRRISAIESFQLDLRKIKERSDPIVSPTHTKRDSSYTKNWGHQEWENHQLPSLRRIVTHIKSWPESPTAFACLPTVLVAVAWSIFVSILTWKFDNFSQWVKASLGFGIGTFSAPIALLLTLRTNRSLDRLFEARAMWGAMLKACNALASIVSCYGTRDPQNSLRIGRYLALFGWSVKGILRNEDDSVLYRYLLTEEDAKVILESRLDNPFALLHQIRLCLSHMSLPTAAAIAADERLGILETAFGVLKRILASPIPPTYTRHTSRILSLYILLLPFSLLGVGMSPMATAFSVAVTTYIFIGIDEIGMEIENPFPLLPMYQLSCRIQDNVESQFLM